ncbi:MAG: VOC family protein [Planctomycetota bacterium]
MHANNVAHFAIHADDVERAKSFYENTFGWQFTEWGPPGFYLIQTGNESSPGIRGALQIRQEPVGTGFNGFECSISVENIKQSTAAIIENGGNIVLQEVEIPMVGRIVKFSDTESNIACVVQYADTVK